MTPAVRNIMLSLTAPKMKREIELKAGLLLQGNQSVRRELSELNAQFLKKLDEIHAILKAPDTTKTTLAHQGNDITASICQLDSQLYDLEKLLAVAAKKVFSYERAFAMAKNVYTKGALKRLRDNMRILKKKRGALPDEKYFALEKDLLMQGKALEDHCMRPEAKEKIAEITAGILRKNTPQLLRYQRIKADYEALKQKRSALYGKHAALQPSKAATPASYIPLVSIHSPDKDSEHITQTILRDRRTDDDYDDALLTETERQDRRNDTRSR